MNLDIYINAAADVTEDKHRLLNSNTPMLEKIDTNNFEKRSSIEALVLTILAMVVWFLQVLHLISLMK